MKVAEFTAELSGSATLVIPPDIATQLPKVGRALVIVLTEEGPNADTEWRIARRWCFLTSTLMRSFAA